VDSLFIGEIKATPVGDLWAAASETGLVAIEYGMERAGFVAYLQKRFKCRAAFAPDRVREAVRQVKEYLSGRRREFSLPIDWSVFTPFQQAALRATCAIPRGETRTYHQIALQIGRPRAARAVGRAEATNPMPLVIPCHRVIGTDGKLHGYGMGEGLKTKEWLLKMEGAVIA
jgi:O-6-methylguanine DNA methyltransferase